MSEQHWMTHADRTNDASLQAVDVVYSYNKSFKVLKDIDAQILPGSLLAILGVNGCGKSTLLSCLDDIIRPEHGSILLSGQDLSTISREERAQSIALVAQHSHAHGVTVYDALLLGRKPYVHTAPQAEDYEIVDRVIAELGLEPLALRYLDELSGGEHQKVVIARALVQDTEILLLDEPTNNLDMANQVEVMELVSHIAHEHGIACAAVLHDLNLALRYCDRFLLIKDGTVLAAGDKSIVTKEMIEEAYDVRVDIVEHKGIPFVIPLSCH